MLRLPRVIRVGSLFVTSSGTKRDLAFEELVAWLVEDGQHLWRQIWLWDLLFACHLWKGALVTPGRQMLSSDFVGRCIAS